MTADDEPFDARYVNNFRAGCNRYEFILDFGISFEGREEFQYRIVCCPPYAQELCSVLSKSLNDYRERYGVIELLENGEG